MTDLDKISAYASKAYRAGDNSRWVAAYWASKVVGQYKRDGTLALARTMGISPDAVEDLAHAYMLYDLLRKEPEFHVNVRKCRKWPMVYLSHFRSLYEAMTRYDLEMHEVFSILMDVVQARGSLSSRDVDEHVRSRYGKERPWTYYAQRAAKSLLALGSCPDLPDPLRKRVQELFSVIGDVA